MAWAVVLAGAVLVLGLAALALCSNSAVDSSLYVAQPLGVSPILPGLVLISLGTDFPEIVNALVSAAAGHASIGLGDALGSFLAQFTLVLGLLPIFARPFFVARRRILVTGLCALLGLALSMALVEKGYLTRINAIVLVASWPVLIFLARSAMGDIHSPAPGPPALRKRPLAAHLGKGVLSFAGVAISSYAVIQSVLHLAAAFGLSEYLVSFFAVAIGTSLPELVVDLTAARKGHFELAIGDAIGSCLVDATVTVGIGSLFFPQAVAWAPALATGAYAGVAAPL
jgi:cation:H+ antiporter